mgnify:CR=1 FL=1
MARTAEFEDLIGQYSRTICLAGCYQITGTQKHMRCRKTALVIGPENLIKIKSLLPIKNDSDWMVLARVKTLLSGNQSEAWIWAGDIRR